MKCVLLNVLTWHSAGIIAQNPPQRKNVKYEYHSYIKKKGGGGGRKGGFLWGQNKKWKYGCEWGLNIQLPAGAINSLTSWRLLCILSEEKESLEVDYKKVQSYSCLADPSYIAAHYWLSQAEASGRWTLHCGHLEKFPPKAKRLEIKRDAE